MIKMTRIFGLNITEGTILSHRDGCSNIPVNLRLIQTMVQENSKMNMKLLSEIT